jgi:hypothetical protein
MKLAIVTPFAEPEKGACTVRVNHYKSFFEKKGLIVSVFALKRANLNGEGRYSGAIDLFLKVFFGKFNFVIGTSPPLPHNFVAFIAAKLSGAKFILDAKEDPLVLKPKKEYGLKKIKTAVYLSLRWFVYSFSDIVLFLTKEDFELETKRYKIRNPFLLPNGCSEEIKFSSSARVMLRKKFGFKQNDKVGIYSGSIGDEDLEGVLKNAPYSMKIIFLLVHSTDSIGQNELESFIKLKNKFLPNAVVCSNLGPSEMSEYLSAADYGILPWSNGLFTSVPVKIFDYIAIGVPVVVKGEKPSALYRFIKENNVGFFSDSWSNFFEAIKNLRIKRNKMLVKAFARTNFLNRFWKKLLDDGYVG